MAEKSPKPQNSIQAGRYDHFIGHPELYSNSDGEVVLPQDGNLRFGALVSALRRFPSGYKEEELVPRRSEYVITEAIAQNGITALSLIGQMGTYSSGSYSDIESDHIMPTDADAFISAFTRVLHLSPDKERLLRIVYVYNLVLQSFEERNVPDMDDIPILGMFWSNPREIIEQYNAIVGPVALADSETTAERAELATHRELVRRRGQLVTKFIEIADITGEDLLIWMYELGYNDEDAAKELQGLLAERGVVNPPLYGLEYIVKLRKAFGIKLTPGPKHGAREMPLFKQQRALYNSARLRLDEFGLTVEEKVALQMRFEEGLSLEDAGSKIGVSRDTVRLRQKSAMKKIEVGLA